MSKAFFVVIFDAFALAGSFPLGDECCPVQGNNSCLILNITVGSEFSGVVFCFDPPCSTVGYIFPAGTTDFCNPLLGAVIGIRAPNLEVMDVAEGYSTTFNITGAEEYTCNGGNAPPT